MRLFEFSERNRQTTLGAIFQILELIYVATVRNVRKTHGNAVIGLLTSVLQTIILVVVFYVMFSILGLRGSVIRGSFLLYILSGIFLFLTHNKAVGAVAGAEGPASPMMLHAPMNTAISITSSALASLYVQVLALAVVLFGYHTIIERIEVDMPLATFGMFLIAWGSGCAVGLVFLALKPWAPGLIGIVQQIYTRANMVASGKMFVANQLPGYMIAMFSWNPLFHCIDQARGFAFINYNPHYSNFMYPIYLSLIFLMLGMMGEFYTRKQVSVSWSAGK